MYLLIRSRHKITKISVSVHPCPQTHRTKNTEPKTMHLLIQSRHNMDLLTDQSTYQRVHPTQHNLFNPSIDNNIIGCSCSGEQAGYVWRVCWLLRADQGKDIYCHKGFPRIANIHRRLLTLGPKGREEHNVSSTKQNGQWMTWVILARPSDAEPPLLSGRSPAETANFGLFKQQRVTL